MSLRYTDTYITDYGYRLIGKSIDGTKKIVWDEARTSSNNIDSLSASEIVALHRVNFESSFTCKGHVTKAVYNDAGAGVRSVSLSCQLNGDSSPDGHGSTDSFVICAKLEDDPDSAYDVAIIARSGQGHVPEVIPGDGEWQADVSFILNLHDTSISGNIIAAPDSFYATASDLNALSERVVTTHAEGSPTTGETQTIYGQKTFKDNVVLDGSATFNGIAKFYNNANFTQAIETADVVPSSTGTHDLGGEEHKWRKVYSVDGDFESISADDGDFYSQVSASSASFDSAFIGALTANSIGTSTWPVSTIFATTIGSQEHPVTSIYGTIQGNIDGTADRANKDGSGNVITDTYVTLGTPQTITGKKTFQNSILIDKSTTTPNNGLLEVYGIDGIKLKAKADAYAEFMPFTEYTNQTGTIGTKFVWRDSSKQSFTTTFIMSGTAQTAAINSIVTEPPKTEVWSIGTSSNKLNEVHANYFRGAADSATAANTINILGRSGSGSYPLVFAESINASTSSAVSKALYTDTANTLYYNPNTNKLTIVGNWNNSGLEFRYSTSDTSVSTCISERSSNTTPGITADFKVGSTSVARIITDATVSDATLTGLTTYPVSSLGAGVWSIGTNANKLNEIYANNFRGTADSATNLSSAPSLSFSAATSSSAGSTLTVTAGGKTSSSVTIGKVRSAFSADKWATPRSFYITTSDGAHTGSAVSVDGSGSVTLKLPSTIVIPNMTPKSSSSIYFNIDVGGIFLAYVKYTRQNAQNTARVGYTVTVTDSYGKAGDWTISQACFNNNGGWTSGGTYATPGTYRLLSELTLSSTIKHSTMSDYGAGIALMIRIS